MNLKLDGINDANLTEIIRVINGGVESVSGTRPYVHAFLGELVEALSDELEVRTLTGARSEGSQAIELPTLAELRLFERKALVDMFDDFSKGFDGINQAVCQFFFAVARGIDV